MEYHPVSNLFPMMSGEEFEALVNDIKANGLQESIWTHEGKIIDGRNRYKACMQAGVTPSFRVWDGRGSLVQLVVSLNLKRRHLSSSQKAMVAADMLPLMKKEREEEQKRVVAERPRTANGTFQPRVEGIPHMGEAPRSRDNAASAVGTNPRYVTDANLLKEKAPDLATKVREGTITLPEAKTLVHLTKEKRAEVMAKVESGGAKNVQNAQRKLKQEELQAQAKHIDENPPPLVEARFRVIEADPPWALDANEGKSGGNQYPVMTTEAICAMGSDVLKRADENCHLYLWAINPMLPEAFQVLRAWGFEFKTMLTWVKTDGFGTGHYFRGSTEHVLFGVRGKLDTLHNDQPTHFTAPRTKHSAKPDEFYQIVERMSMGPRLRLFARSQREGWTSWGDQA